MRHGLWCTSEGGGLITLLCRCKDMPSPCYWCVPLMLPSSVFAQTLAINCCKGVDIVVPEGWDVFCSTLVLLSDSIRRMFWEWAHACVKVSTFTTIIQHTKLPKWHENRCHSQLYTLIDTHILKYFLHDPNNLSFQKNSALFTEVSDFPNLRKDPVIKRWTCCFVDFGRVIGSHHRPYNLQYSCCHVAYD